MALSAFDDRSREPGAEELRRALGRSSARWDELIGHLAIEQAPLHSAWTFAGVKWGWSLRLKRRKRTILYMTPREGHFLAGFALGEKAVAAAHQAGLPEALLRAIDGAPKYAEGRGVRLEVRSQSDLDEVKQLAAIKMAS